MVLSSETRFPRATRLRRPTDADADGVRETEKGREYLRAGAVELDNACIKFKT
jgi:hypothetical protein